jgi:hypothetical protein
LYDLRTECHKNLRIASKFVRGQTQIQDGDLINLQVSFRKESRLKRNDTHRGYDPNNRTIPNVVVEWLTLLLRIPKVPASYLGSEIGCPG